MAASHGARWQFSPAHLVWPVDHSNVVAVLQGGTKACTQCIQHQHGLQRCQRGLWTGPLGLVWELLEGERGSFQEKGPPCSACGSLHSRGLKGGGASTNKRYFLHQPCSPALKPQTNRRLQITIIHEDIKTEDRAEGRGTAL